MTTTRQRRNAMASTQDLVARLGLSMPPPPLAVNAPTGLQTRSIESLDRFIRHPGFGLTPQRVVQIYRQAEWGWCQEQCDLFEDIIENDGHLRSVIEARTLAVAGKDWSVLPGADDNQSRKAAEILEAALRATNFADAISFIVSARYYGFSLSEIQWGKQKGADVPTWFVTIPHRRVAFDAFDNPMIVNSVSSIEGDRLTPGRFVFAHNTGPLTSRIARSGLMRSATWYSLFKRWSWRDWVIYAEKFGIPLVIGKYDQDATEDVKDELQETVENIGEDGQAIMSKAADVEIKEVSSGGDSNGLHRSIVDESNREISKLITGSTLTTDSGGAGSFALGKVHETRAFDLVVSDAKLVAERFAWDIARPFLAFNGFQDAAVPRLKISIAREMDPIARAEMFKLAQDLGVELDEEQVREEMVLRTPTAGKGLKPPAAAAPTPPGDSPDQGGSVPSEGEPPESDSD